MKSEEILKEVFCTPQIAEDCNLFNLNESETLKDFNSQFREFFGEEVCEIITSTAKDSLGAGTYVYGYSGTHIITKMPDVILILYSNDNKENGKCIFLWRVED